MFKFAHDVDPAEERFAIALEEFAKLALSPRRGSPDTPPLDARQRELIALAHRALWFGVELRLGDRERSARGFAAAELLHGEARAALRREIAYAREMHILSLYLERELPPEPGARSELRMMEVARSWSQAASELGMSTFARWLGEPNVLRELVELFGDLLRVVRVTALPLRADGPDPAYLRSLLALARQGESGAAPRGQGLRDLSPETREAFRQEATRSAKLSALLRHDSGERSLDPPLRERVEAIARGSDSSPAEAKLSSLSTNRVPAPREPLEGMRSARLDGHPANDVAPAAPNIARTESMADALAKAQLGARGLFRVGLALATLALLAMLAISFMPVAFWWGATEPSTSTAPR